MACEHGGCGCHDHHDADRTDRLDDPPRPALAGCCGSVTADDGAPVIPAEQGERQP